MAKFIFSIVILISISALNFSYSQILYQNELNNIELVPSHPSFLEVLFPYKQELITLNSTLYSSQKNSNLMPTLLKIIKKSEQQKNEIDRLTKDFVNSTISHNEKTKQNEHLILQKLEIYSKYEIEKKDINEILSFLEFCKTKSNFNLANNLTLAIDYFKKAKCLQLSYHEIFKAFTGFESISDLNQKINYSGHSYFVNSRIISKTYEATNCTDKDREQFPLIEVSYIAETNELLIRNDSKSTQNFKCEVYSIEGRLIEIIKTEELSIGLSKIKLSNLPNNKLLILKYLDLDSQVISKKIKPNN